MTKEPDAWFDRTIKSCEYDNVKGELTITFPNDAQYVYEDVPEALYNEFCDSPERGKFFYGTIRKGNFKYRKL